MQKNIDKRKTRKTLSPIVAPKLVKSKISYILYLNLILEMVANTVRFRDNDEQELYKPEVPINKKIEPFIKNKSQVKSNYNFILLAKLIK